MPKRRPHINLTTKLAAALLARGEIPFAEGKTLTAKQIISRYDFDHYPVPVWAGGIDAPWNLQPMLRQAHREKSAKVDKPQSSKSTRIRADEAAHRAAMGAKDDRQPVERPARVLPSRPMPGSRKSPYKRKFSGVVERRS